MHVGGAIAAIHGLVLHGLLGAEPFHAGVPWRLNVYRMVHETDIVELELKSKRFNLTVKKKEALLQVRHMHQDARGLHCLLLRMRACVRACPIWGGGGGATYIHKHRHCREVLRSPHPLAHPLPLPCTASITFRRLPSTFLRRVSCFAFPGPMCLYVHACARMDMAMWVAQLGTPRMPQMPLPR